MNDPFQIFEEIRRAYLRYLDSPFRLRYDVLLDERRKLLNRDRQLYRDPLFEPIAPYESSGRTVSAACEQLGIRGDVAEFINLGLFPAGRTLHRHQYEAWEATRRGEAVVVTSGTGSGKTECYLLPIFASLAEELASYRSRVPTPSAPWWSARGSTRTSQRAHEASARPAAVRALLLYPLNALIEDQLSRIREASATGRARQWLDAKRAQHRIWFGRYTGATPVSGSPTSSNKSSDLKRRLRRMDREWQRAIVSSANRKDEKILSYFQDPASSEMWSRWDMQDAPPDILITNYSMLNIMLMRGVENAIFDSTRTWLASDPAHRFHLVVDELHTYRGTPGTEVGYLLRVLLDRLGLTPDSPQLRILATSASITDDDASRIYLEQFFGRGRDSFKVVPGYPKRFEPAAASLSTHGPSFAQLSRRLAAEEPNASDVLAAASGVSEKGAPSEVIAKALDRLGAFAPMLSSASEGPVTVEQLADALFHGQDDGEESAKGLLRALVLARTSSDENAVAPLPIRVHYFFHNAGRLWACVNPGCSVRSPNVGGGTPPPVGRLYTEPRPRCDSCQARVLELLYCQPCGEVFLGGYAKPDPDAPSGASFLTPDFADLESVPDRSASLKRTADEYAVFWPAHARALANGAQQWMEDGQRGFRWVRATLDHVSGRIARQGPRTRGGHGGMTNGFVFEVPATVTDANAFASRCPHCGADWHARRVGSPIRDLGSGFQRIVQLLCDALLRGMKQGAGRKLVLFSDSRQDAAKLSTGIKLAHYRDTLRQLAFGQLQRRAASALTRQAARDAQSNAAAILLDLERKNVAGTLGPEERRSREELLATLPAESVVQVLLHAVRGGPAPPALTPPPPPGGFDTITFRHLLDDVRSSLLSIGVNPGGPRRSLSGYRPERGARVDWASLVSWREVPRRYRDDLQPIELRLRDDIEGGLLKSLVEDVLFADGSRDFESLGLGLLWCSATPPSTKDEQAAASVIRLLARRRLWNDGQRQSLQQAPSNIDRYLGRVASATGDNPASLEQRVLTILGGANNQWLLQPLSMNVVSPRANGRGQIETYVCARCARIHLHPAAGFCTECLEVLPEQSVLRDTATDASDYYEFLARCEDPAFRLNCEELTGQTNREDRIVRQRRFQEVFTDDENDDADGVDLLSVTTTMEAGVDIGALQGIALANMPPVRFNYQQRVGRAGRRGLGMSVALTLCRGRSHDEYYFERPRLITADPPPRPYVDVSSAQIAKRIVNKEVLRRAFDGVLIATPTDNVHGEFGVVSDWNQHRAQVDAWITGSAAAIESVCRAIARRTAMDSEQGRAMLTSHVRLDLLRAIDEVASHPESHSHLPLSERLAALGVLPMFGFPTRVRYLFHERPKLGIGGWPPERGVVDRELEIAIGQFAPGAQTVKDDALLTAVGVVDYRPAQGTVQAAPDPLDPIASVGVCRRCQALVRPMPTSGGCTFCSAARDDGFRGVQVAQPPGFTTWHRIEAEFTGGFEFTPRALRARMSATPGQSDVRDNYSVARCRAEVYRINDNDGRDFEFFKLDGQHVWVTQAAFDQALLDLPRAQRARITPPQPDAQAPRLTRALGALAITDVLTAGIESVQVGLCLNPAVPEARAAWYSLGFLLRRAAAAMLDVHEAELDVGIHPVMDFSSPFAPPSARIFMSDTLENGAGYSTHLGDPERFGTLLRWILGQRAGQADDRFYGPLIKREHEEECASSCHRCLRDFSNMAFHPLLDWRLALDMVRLALDPAASIDFQGAWAPLVQRVVGSYFTGRGLARATFGGLDAGLDATLREAVIVTHPLWDAQRGWSNIRADLAAAIAEAEANGWKPRPLSLFRIVRFPYE